MQCTNLTRNKRRLAQGAAILLVAGLSAGCSSDLMRFDPGLSASATANSPVYQQQAQAAPVYDDSQVYQDPQPYPGTYPAAQADDVDLTTTASINRRAVRQPSLLRNSVRRDRRAPVPSVDVGVTNTAPRQPFPQQQAATQPFPTQPRQLAAPVSRQPLAAPAPDNIDRTVTGSIQKQPVVTTAATPKGQEGWNSAGGTQITVREGETVYNLSRRFGVPAKAILRANSMSEASALKAGQTLVIPTYVYSGGTSASAPDANPKAAAAPSVAKNELPSQVPLPTKAPSSRVAVLPQPARVPEPASAASAATTGAVYTVVAGDTLSGIAQKTGSSTNAIKQANGLDSGLIKVGQKLVIPGGNVQTTVASAPPPGVDPIVTGGVTKPAGGYTAPEPGDAEIENMVSKAAAAPDATGVGRLRWPVHGRIVSDFGSQSGGKRNDGIDIAVPEGTPVKAAENGVVIYAGDGLKDFGNTVLVRHENGLVTVYGHNSQIIVSRGATVRRGQELARSGLSGNAGSPKLHFEVRKDSAPVDPAKYLE